MSKLYCKISDAKDTNCILYFGARKSLHLFEFLCMLLFVYMLTIYNNSPKRKTIYGKSLKVIRIIRYQGKNYI